MPWTALLSFVSKILGGFLIYLQTKRAGQLEEKLAQKEANEKELSNVSKVRNTVAGLDDDGIKRLRNTKWTKRK